MRAGAFCASSYDRGVKPIVIVQHQASVPAGHIRTGIEEAGAEIVVLDAWRDASWPAIDDVGALVVLGGTMNVDQLDDYPFLKQSRDLMSEALEKEVPTLGVCLGSQMMARVLGAEVFRAEPRNALFSMLELTDEGRSDALVGPFDGVSVLQFHEDTFTVPGDAVPLARSSSSGLPQAFRFGNTAYAIQFHFEVDRAIVEGWIHNIGRREMLDDWGISDEELLRDADEHLERQRVAGRVLVRRFLENVR